MWMWRGLRRISGLRNNCARPLRMEKDLNTWFGTMMANAAHGLPVWQQPAASRSFERRTGLRERMPSVNAFWGVCDENAWIISWSYMRSTCIVFSRHLACTLTRRDLIKGWDSGFPTPQCALHFTRTNLTKWSPFPCWVGYITITKEEHKLRKSYGSRMIARPTSIHNFMVPSLATPPSWEPCAFVVEPRQCAYEATYGMEGWLSVKETWQHMTGAVSRVLLVFVRLALFFSHGQGEDAFSLSGCSNSCQ